MSDTVNEFRAFSSPTNYLRECLYWLSPCSIFVVRILMVPSMVMMLLLGLVALCTLWLFVSQVTEESVLIIKDFGIQLRMKYRTGSEETKVVFS